MRKGYDATLSRRDQYWVEAGKEYDLQLGVLGYGRL